MHLIEQKVMLLDECYYRFRETRFRIDPQTDTEGLSSLQNEIICVPNSPEQTLFVYRFTVETYIDGALYSIKPFTVKTTKFLTPMSDCCCNLV